MNLPVSDIIEQSISNKVNGMVGNNDINLNTIVKMSLLNEIKPLDTTKMLTVLESIYDTNKIEAYFNNNEYELTIDSSGNIIYVNEEQDKKDIVGILREPEGCEE